MSYLKGSDKKIFKKKKNAVAALNIKDKIIYHFIFYVWWVCYRLDWDQVCSRRTDRSCGPLLRSASSLIHLCMRNRNWHAACQRDLPERWGSSGCIHWFSSIFLMSQINKKGTTKQFNLLVIQQQKLFFKYFSIKYIFIKYFLKLNMPLNCNRSTC